MRRISFIFAACLMASPALAGNLTFDNGHTDWHSTQCTAPTPPEPLTGAAPDTPGNDMNSLVAAHNAYVAAAQQYMDCLNQEADRDQVMVNQAIASSAQNLISATQKQIEDSEVPLREREEQMRHSRDDD